jgi:hypothetical protein
MGGWDQGGSWGDRLRVCAVDSPSSEWGLMAGCCEQGDEPSCSNATDVVVIQHFSLALVVVNEY